MKLVTDTVIVPAGRYWLADPCYSISNDEVWMELLTSSNFFMDSPVGTSKGYEVLAFGTAYGDGVYPDNRGREYAVDAGLIGLVPMELRESEYGVVDAPDTYMAGMFGQELVFTTDTKCWTDGEGGLYFGDIVISTGDSTADEDEDEDEDED
jgi:hypothetical protein